nr:RecT family recombinase [Cupriavidus sp. D384]
MTDLQTALPSPAQPTVPDLNAAAMIVDAATIESIDRVARVMMTGRSTVPKHLQGNQGDCFAVVMQSMQWGMNPFSVAQKTHLVNGTLGYEAQLVNAVITNRAPIKSRLHFEWFGDWDRIAGRFKEVPARNNPDEKRIVRDWLIEDEKGLGVRVWATFRDEDQPRELRLLLSQAGVRNSPLWGQDPKQQLAYLAVKRWARLYCPDVILGVYTADELESPLPQPERDMGKVEDVRQPDSTTASRASRVKDKLQSRGGQVTDVPSQTASASAPAPAPALDEVLGAIGAATNSAELSAAGQLASQMPDGPDKERARKAYDEKLKAGKAAAAGSQANATASASVPTKDGDVLTYAQVMDALHQATTVDALNLAADLIRYVPDEGQQEELRVEFEGLRGCQ